jgi:MFS family permease
MAEELFSEKIRVCKRKYFAVFVLVITALAYFYTMSNVLTDFTTALAVSYSEKSLIMAAYYVGVGISTAVGAFLSNGFVRRRTLLFSWLFFSMVSLLLSLVVEDAPANAVAIISWIWGLSVGLGMPSSMASFADATEIERRGRIGGLLAFAFNIFLFGLTLSLNALAPARRAQAFMIWLGFTLFVMILFRQDSSQSEETKNPSVLSVLHEARFVLYLVPWIMFCLVNSLEAPILKHVFGSDFFNLAMVAELAISSISALIGGLVADRMGRKLVAVVGFALLGLGYAILGLFPEFAISHYLYVVVDGTAWGMFVVIFFMVLWGDLAGSMSKDRYYLLGGLPFLLSSLIQLPVEPIAESISMYAAFSFASFFLFLAVLPLLYAPETLPEKKIRDRELRSYVEKAKKAKEKYV